MNIQAGYYYHIQDSYFSLVKDSTLMSNKENGAYRPHYLAIQDSNNPGIYWMVPVSSQYAKYQAIHDKIIEKYGLCTKIVLGKCGGRAAAYLIQNAFPITSDFIHHVHTLKGQPLTIHEGTKKLVISALRSNLSACANKPSLFYTDTKRLYQLMVQHLIGEI